MLIKSVMIPLDVYEKDVFAFIGIIYYRIYSEL